MTGMEHPDHTGSSSNPAAPWNQPDVVQFLRCNECSDEPDDGDDVDEGDDCLNAEDQFDPCPGTYQLTNQGDDHGR